MGEANPRLMSYRAADFVDDLREKIEADRPKESACDRLGGEAGR